MASRPFAWEKSYPPGVRWDTPIRISTIGSLIDTATATFGTRAAFEFRDQIITYEDLGRRVRQFAAALLQAGLGTNDTVALYLPNIPTHPISFFGAGKAGVRLVHLSPLDAERVLAYKLKDSGARTLVTSNIAPLFGMALKLHAQAAESRGFGSAMGAYNKELFFYMDIQKQIPLRTPEALAIWTDGTPLDVFPQNVEYFCLMMAHLGDEGWETYGVVDPPSYEELESMMPSLIKLHSARQHAHISRSATRVLGRAPRCRPRACMHGAPTD